MTKLVRLTLSKIKYTGDSIGDDIRIEISCLNHSVGVNKKIKHGSEIALNIPVGNFTADQLSLLLPLSIKLIEQDIIYNDIGSAEKEFKVDVINVMPQQLTVIIAIQEVRNYATKKKAVFEITFEALVSDAIVYVKYQNGGDGWLKVASDGGEKDFSIPYYTQVLLEKQENSRQYLTILEGSENGRKVSVRMNDDGSSFLQTGNPHTAPVYFTYSLSTRILRSKKRSYTTIDYKYDQKPWEKRLYDIAIPDYPHKGGESYLDKATLAKVWFKVSHPDNERYLHTGERTAGCITITEVKRWDELCNILLKARKGDGKNIGVVEIIE